MKKQDISELTYAELAMVITYAKNEIERLHQVLLLADEWIEEHPEIRDRIDAVLGGEGEDAKA